MEIRLKKNPRISIDEPFNFSCIRCDVCCGTGPNVSLTIYDVVRMAKALDVDAKTFLRLYTKVIIADLIPHISLAGDENGRCVFLGFQKNEKEEITFCKIYEWRPMRCRLYPVLPIKLGLDHVELDEKCPGLEEHGGKKAFVPRELLKKFNEEVKKHYDILFKKIIVEGKEPMQALDESLDELVYEVKNNSGVRWVSPDYLGELEQKLHGHTKVK